MSASFVQKLRDDTDEVKYYGIEPQLTAISFAFELRLKDGTCDVCEFSQHCRTTFESSGTEVKIRLLEDVIIIKGRNLKEIVPYIRSHRLIYIQEDYSGQDTGDSKMFVESIEIISKYPEDLPT
jgi:hypothetical protein